MLDPTPTLSAPLDWDAYYTTRQAATILDLTSAFVLDLMRDGKLAGLRLPTGGFIFARAGVDALARERAAAKQAKLAKTASASQYKRNRRAPHC